MTPIATLECPDDPVEIRKPTAEQIVDRLTAVPPWALLIQLFIGFGWLRAVAEKVIDPGWWTGSVIDEFVASRADQTLIWYRPFLDRIVEPGTPAIALAVLGLQLIAGVSLVTGRRLGLGLSVGIFLNLHFMASGAVTPSAFYLLAQGALALWLAGERPGIVTTLRLRFAAMAATFLAALNVPFLSTVHPEHVIEDPAMMFAFGGGLVALTCLLTSVEHSPEVARVRV